MLNIISNDVLTQIIIPLLSLTAVEIILGIDNIIFLTLLVDKLPEKYRPKARTMGLFFAMLTRIALLFTITWIMSFDRIIYKLFFIDITGKKIILIFGGAFLIIKSIAELRYSAKTKNHTIDDENTTSQDVTFFTILFIILQIGIMDIVFSLDSVITAIGLVDNLNVMIAAIVISIIVMLIAAKPISNFIKNKPYLRCHALCFLILVGISIIAEAVGYNMPKKLIYASFSYALFVELCVAKTNSRQIK